jgi:predicted porin
MGKYIMKKSLLALAVVAAATSANAATVYDKDGTSLAVGGRVQAVVYNGNAAGIAENDAGLVNSARLNIAGSTKINDSVSVFAFSEWNMADGNTSGQSWGDSINTREQYVGADYGDFGKILGGKTYDAANAVLAATDVFEDFGARLQGSINGDRRTGMFRYVYDNNGIFGSVSYQTAADGSSVAGNNADVEGGFAAAAGYTFDNVVFGPLSFKAGYSYIKGQNDFSKTIVQFENSETFDNFKVISASIAWGSTDNGLYIGALYNTQRVKQRANDFVPSNSSNSDKKKGYEFVVGYTFDNGIGAFTGYNFVDQKYKVGSINQGTATIRRVPVYVNYAITDNFNIWGEAEFDANSSTTKDGQRQYPEFETGTMLSAGARYTF